MDGTESIESCSANEALQYDSETGMHPVLRTYFEPDAIHSEPSLCDSEYACPYVANVEASENVTQRPSRSLRRMDSQAAVEEYLDAGSLFAAAEQQQMIPSVSGLQPNVDN